MSSSSNTESRLHLENLIPQILDLLKGGLSLSGSIPPKLEHKLRHDKQRFGKIATTVVSEKDENLLLRLQWHRSCHSSEMTLLPISIAAVVLGTGNCSSKIVYGSFFFPKAVSMSVKFKRNL